MMAADARISTGLPSHPKTKKLIRRLGPAGGWGLVCLFLWAASNRSDGDLSGMTDEDIELAADWGGADGAFIGELAKVRFLDGEVGTRAIHDWAEHNPWAAGAKMRSQKAQWNAAKRHHGVAEANRQVPEYAALRDAACNAGSTSAAGEDGAGCMQPAEDSIAPSPSPSPFPFPFPFPSPSPSPSPSPIPTSPPPDGGVAPRKRSTAAGVGRPDDVAEQTWVDWLALRKAKKAPVTETVVDGARREAVTAGLPLDAFLQVWCMRGSQGLQADWLKPHERQTQSRALSTSRFTAAAAAIFDGATHV
ncbi:hypothetical protein [Hydrogenophaga sp.]|uniref:hypothetical protein n=1 Tax=Hydrogenophaga sp. TaxID=1904254 RepID=UPI0025C0E4F4|nr:hypothetical protein [Hydrogenophaga sp.]MBT9462541.1 hypothetical protein [Hydrogenophaga sp.]